jgi:hypothetical protein
MDAPVKVPSRTEHARHWYFNLLLLLSSFNNHLDATGVVGRIILP